MPRLAVPRPAVPRPVEVEGAPPRPPSPVACSLPAAIPLVLQNTDVGHVPTRLLFRPQTSGAAVDGRRPDVDAPLSRRRAPVHPPRSPSGARDPEVGMAGPRRVDVREADDRRQRFGAGDPVGQGAKRHGRLDGTGLGVVPERDAHERDDPLFLHRRGGRRAPRARRSTLRRLHAPELVVVVVLVLVRVPGGGHLHSDVDALCPGPHVSVPEPRWRRVAGTPVLVDAATGSGRPQRVFPRTARPQRGRPQCRHRAALGQAPLFDGRDVPDGSGDSVGVGVGERDGAPGPPIDQPAVSRARTGLRDSVQRHVPAPVAGRSTAPRGVVRAQQHARRHRVLARELAG